MWPFVTLLGGVPATLVWKGYRPRVRLWLMLLRGFRLFGVALQQQHCFEYQHPFLVQASLSLNRLPYLLDLCYHRRLHRTCL